MEGRNKISSGRRSRWFFLIIGLVVGVVLTSTFYSMKENNAGIIMAKNIYDDNLSVKSVPAFYIDLEPFTLNLNSIAQSGGRVLYIGLTLKLNSDDTQKVIKDLLPEIRSQLLIIFSQQTAESLLTIEGKQQLAIETKNTINQLIINDNETKVVDVLFNAFILR